MRYIYYIVAFVIGLSLLAGSFLMLQPESGEPFLTVNKRVYSQQEFEQLQKAPANRDLQKNELLDDLVIRELLLQQARARHLDRDPRFLLAIRQYYEQTLVKNLLEDQIDRLDMVIGQAELESYRNCLRQRYQIRLKFAQGDHAAEKRIESDFFDLPMVLQQQLISYDSERTFYYADTRVRMEIVASEPAEISPELSDDDIRASLSAALRQQALNRWLTDLRQAAEIKVEPLAEPKGGQS